MLRSFSYAAYVALLNFTARRPHDFEKLEPWAKLWEESAMAEFLRAYLVTTHDAEFLPQDPSSFRILLETYLVDKVLYELRYELDHRPAWVRIPLHGILSLEL